jgi:hypothetical protein
MGVVAEVGKQCTWTFGIVLVVFPYLEKKLANFWLCPRSKTFWMFSLPVGIHSLSTDSYRLRRQLEFAPTNERDIW